jgi:hypothetical protein
MDSSDPHRSSSRFVELREPRAGSVHEHRPTSLFGAPLGPHPTLFHQRFVASYQGIRTALAAHTAPGVALVAADEQGIAASAWLAAKVGELNSAIIGRHLAADLLLERDETLSLRHLALLVHPMRARCDVRFRLLDLRTASAFTDEHGRRLGALEAEGPAFVLCGRYCLFLLATGDEVGWPDDAATGWQCIPERIYFGEQAAEPDRWQRRVHGEPVAAAVRPRGFSTLRVLPSPVAAGRSLVGAGEPALGVLDIDSPTGQDAVRIGPSAARDGVLLGRYERCDSHGLASLCDSRVSRVHCLLIEVDGVLYAVDVASQNGLFARAAGMPGCPPIDCRVRSLPLCSGDELSLGMGLNRLRWRAVGSDPATPQPPPPIIVSPLLH